MDIRVFLCIANIPLPGIDLKPTNILLELESPNNAIAKYLSVVPPRMADPQRGAPLREVITTPPISEIKHPHVKIIDFGVGKYTTFPGITI